MEVHQLEYVLALEQHKHFSIAADEINVSQPTLSHQIKKLEAELGVNLFVRTTRSVKLTPAGEDFVVYARRIVADIQNAKKAMLEHTDLRRGSINIGAVPNVTHLGITTLIVSFKKNYPGISIKLVEDNTEALLQRMHAHEIDAAFVNSPDLYRDLYDFYPLHHDRFVVSVPCSHALADKKNIHLAELSQEKFILFKMGDMLRNEFTRLCRSAGFEPDVIFESSHTETMKGLVEEGVGILLSSRSAAISMSSLKTAVIDLTPSIKRITGLAVHKNSGLLSTRTFRDFILGHQDSIASFSNPS